MPNRVEYFIFPTAYAIVKNVHICQVSHTL